MPSRAAIRRVLMYFVGLPSEVNLAQTLGDEGLVVFGKVQMLENEALVAPGRFIRGPREGGGLDLRAGGGAWRRGGPLGA